VGAHLPARGPGAESRGAADANEVAVSREALVLLDDRELRAILAHELGQHAGFDAGPLGLIV
jgi:Zn-dependent protease with chaperone function